MEKKSVKFSLKAESSNHESRKSRYEDQSADQQDVAVTKKDEELTQKVDLMLLKSIKELADHDE